MRLPVTPGWVRLVTERPTRRDSAIVRYGIIVAVAAATVGASLLLDRYNFPDTSQLSSLDQLTNYGSKSITETDVVDLYVRYAANGEKYRPIANIGYLIKYYGIRRWIPQIGVFVNVACMLLAGIALYLIANRISARPWFNLLVPILCLTTPVFIAQSWLHVVTEDALVVAFSAFAVLAYVEWRRTDRTAFFVAAATLAFLGPYYKEPTISSSVALCVIELFSFRWSRAKWPLIVLGLIAVNSMYPSVLSNLVFFGEWIPPSFSTHFAHKHRWYTAMSQHLVMQLPPTLVLFGLIGIAFEVGRRMRRDLVTEDGRVRAHPELPPDQVVSWVDWAVSPLSRTSASSVGGRRLVVGLSILLTLGVLGCALCMFHAPVDIDALAAGEGSIQNSIDWYPKQSPANVFFWLLAVLGFITYLQGNVATRVVVLWFGATYVGMARYFFIDHHMMYVLPGFCLLLVYWMQLGYDRLLENSGTRVGRIGLVAALVLGGVALLDAPLQLVNSVAVHHAINRAQSDVLGVLPGDRPSILVSNSILAYDVATLRADETERAPHRSSISAGRLDDDERSAPENYVQAEYAVAYGQPHIAIGATPMMTLAQFRRLRDEAAEDSVPIYLMHNRRSFWPFWPLDEQAPMSKSLSTESVETVGFETPLWFADPLRHVTPLFFAPHPVPPDFYREVIVERGSAFRHVINGSLDLYRLAAVDDEAPEPGVDSRIFGDSELVEANYHGFSLFRLESGYVAVPGPVPALDARFVYWHAWNPSYVGDTLEGVKRMARCSAQSEGAVVTASTTMLPHFHARRLLVSQREIWHSQSPPVYPEHLVVELPEPRAVNGLRLMTQIGSANRNPGEFALLGSDDGQNWTEVFATTDIPEPLAENPWRQWDFDNDQPYRQYQLRIDRNGGDAHYLTIQSMQLLWD